LGRLIAVSERPVNGAGGATRTLRCYNAAMGAPYACTTAIAGSCIVSTTTLLAITSARARII